MERRGGEEGGVSYTSDDPPAACCSCAACVLLVGHRARLSDVAHTSAVNSATMRQRLSRALQSAEHREESGTAIGMRRAAVRSGGCCTGVAVKRSRVLVELTTGTAIAGWVGVCRSRRRRPVVVPPAGRAIAVRLALRPGWRWLGRAAARGGTVRARRRRRTAIQTAAGRRDVTNRTTGGKCGADQRVEASSKQRTRHWKGPPTAATTRTSDEPSRLHGRRETDGGSGGAD